MATVVARFDRGERAVFGHHAFGRRAAIAGVVAGVVALHAALITVARWETPASHAAPTRVRIVDAVLIAPIPLVPHKSEEPAQTSLASRSIHEAVRNDVVQPARTRPAARVHAQDVTRTTPPRAAPPAADAAAEAAMPTEHIAGPQPQPAPVAQAPAIDTPRRVAHLDCMLTKPDYPAQSLRRAEAGTAIIELDTAADGHVVAARVATTSGYTRLDEAARDAALASRCQPYVEDGKPAPARADVPFTFTLSE
ncbi:energy transducer TonB [Paraburkholderia sp. CNPSo 3274]|uniref:energy transducer TonB n=1 Tax=Paraburkholderia sp. CNPSo 3274 TaxID=2940932 RepID=UPI0020B72904|nr:energy transducer TonB [Paraburkholderia sp. CNPSo 3274]MCP3713051.1 energy transducer TonB [Paraburkholderia sp. CNPSo 3274]